MRSAGNMAFGIAKQKGELRYALFAGTEYRELQLKAIFRKTRSWL